VSPCADWRAVGDRFDASVGRSIAIGDRLRDLPQIVIGDHAHQ
jgi:hypothetical protein